MDDLKSKLTALTGRTTAAKLRNLMPAIDQKVRAGVTHEEILETLNADGFDDLKLTTFRTYLYRYRRKLAPVQSTAPPAAPISAIPDRQTGRDPEPMTDGNPASESEVPEPSISDASSDTLSDIIDPKNRDARTEKYFTKPPIIGRKRSATE